MEEETEGALPVQLALKNIWTSRQKKQLSVSFAMTSKTLEILNDKILAQYFDISNACLEFLLEVRYAPSVLDSGEFSVQDLQYYCVCLTLKTLHDLSSDWCQPRWFLPIMIFMS